MVDQVPVVVPPAAPVLAQRSAEGDVDDLEPAADSRQRQPARQRVPRHREIERVLLRVDVVVPVVDLGARVVEVRCQATAARQQHAVAAGRPLVRHLRRARMQHERFAARARHSFRQRPRGHRGAVPQRRGRSGATLRGATRGRVPSRDVFITGIHVVLSAVFFSSAYTDLSRPLPDCL